MYLLLVLLFSVTSVRSNIVSFILIENSTTLSFKCIGGPYTFYGATYLIRIKSDNGFSYNASKTLVYDDTYVSKYVDISELNLPDNFTFICTTGGKSKTRTAVILKDFFD